MPSPNLGSLSVVDKATSEIIDGFSNANYAFWDVSVGFRIRFPLKILILRGATGRMELALHTLVG
jgi:hypothetical protein